MDGELDLTRLAELQALLGTDLSEIVSTLAHELDSAIEQLERAIDAGDLTAAASAAHAARNSALMIGSRPLLDALSELETGGRAGRTGVAAAGLRRLRACWPDLRRQLERLP